MAKTTTCCVPLLSSIASRHTKRVKQLYTDNDLLPNNPLALTFLLVFVVVDFTSLIQFYALYNSDIFVVILRSAVGATLLNLPASAACTSVVNAKAGITNGSSVKVRVIAAVMAFLLVFLPYASVTTLNALEEGVLYEADEEIESTDNGTNYGIVPVGKVNAEDDLNAVAQEEQSKAEPIELFAAIGLALFPLVTTFLSMFVSLCSVKPLLERRRKLLTLHHENAEDMEHLEQILIVQNASRVKLEGIRDTEKAAAEHQRALILAEGERLKQEARMYLSRRSKNPSEVSNIFAAFELAN